ncbi:kelch repeat-containing protein [Winogradskyella sp.]|uniref:Kelch repeat-containing protein n=1 Tax=Winogradskyella sp. TaxID=1883156 RepID=UPI001B24D633|nr:kelch repeat-containing protein [Winogradskyella sp.]MBO6879442.1 hypothetical protein [Winogradskyella sp.]
MKKVNLILVSIVLLCTACSSDDNGNSQPLNQPPSAVVLTSPIDNALGTDKNISFAYNVPEGDPEGDLITYDIYLNNGNEELKIAEDLNEESFIYNEPLGLNRNYTWRVVAKDNNGGQTESESFSFKTRKANYESLSADYTSRFLHSTLLFNDSFVITGGRDTDGLVTQSRQSLDGVNWSAAPSNFPDRRSHNTVVFQDKIFLFGGRDDVATTTFTDVYELADLSNGTTWELVTSDHGFNPRVSNTLIVFDGKMYAIGGFENNAGAVTRYQEVISSIDGETWQEETTQAQFGPRSAHTSVVFDNKMWVIAGSGELGETNDVWFSENGVDWSMATANAGFTARNSHTSVVYDNKIWVYGGYDDNDNILGDLWYSEDGVNWHEAKFEADGTGELPIGLNFSSLVVKEDAMYVIGGTDSTGSLINYTIKIQ